MSIEPLLDPKNERISLFPLKFKDIYEYSVKLQQNYWTLKDISFRQDAMHIKGAEDGEKNLIKYIMGFFLYADKFVIEFINKKVLPKVVIPELRSYYSQKEANEDIHAGTYSMGAHALFDEEFESFLTEMESDDAIKEKLGWAKDWIVDEKASFAQCMLACSLFEGLAFQGLFCAIYILCQSGKFPGLRFSNEIISRDENLHNEAEIYFYLNYISNKLSTKDVHKMIKSLVQTEIVFIKAALKYEVLGMSIDSMIQYVQFVADNQCRKLKILPIYGVENPYPVMNKMSVKRKTNFFEDRDANYGKLEVVDDGIYDWKEVEKF